MRLDNKTLHAFSRLHNEGGTDFKLFIDAVQVLLDERETELILSRESIDTFRAQGSVIDLREIMNKLAGARDTIATQYQIKKR